MIEQVSSLPHGTIFTLIGFGPVTKYFDDILINPENIEKIVKILTDMKPHGGTPMYKVLDKALDHLKNGKIHLPIRKIILITDGYPDRGCSKENMEEPSFQQFMKFPEQFREYKASVDAVGALSDHNVLLLYEIAKRTAGKYIFADSAEELQEKMTVASNQATMILHNAPQLMIKPISGKVTVEDAVQYKPTIIRAPFEQVENGCKAWLRSMEAGDEYQLLIKSIVNLEDVSSIPLDQATPILDLEFDFGDGLKVTKPISITLTNDPGKYRMNHNLNKTYVSMFEAAEEISVATIKGDAEKTQQLQGDETKKFD